MEGSGERIADSPGAAGRRAGGLLVLALGGTTLGLAVPFLGRAPVVWAEQNGLLLAGTLSLAAAVFVHAWLTTSLGRALGLLVTVTAVAYAAELTGVRTGIPFGARYVYHPDLQPRLPGGVPLFIPLAWYVIASAPVVLLRSTGIASHWGKVVLAALYLVGTDLFLDPLSVAVKAWTWEGGGGYFGVPWTNSGGWFLVGLLVFHAAFPAEAAPPSAIVRRLDRAYVFVLFALTLLGFAATVWRVGDIRPVLLASVVLSPYWIAAIRTMRR